MTWWIWGAELGPEGSLVWTTAPWAIALLSLVALGLLGLTMWGERAWRSRLSEGLFWCLALFGLVVALAGPTWVEEEGRTEPGRLAVLVDASKSMTVLEEGVPRSNAVKPLLDNLEGPATDWFYFGSDLVVGRPGSFDLGNTDIEGALEGLSERFAGEKLAGVVLITDGLDRGLLRKRYRREDNPAVGSLPGPLTVYQVGRPERVTDLSIREVNAGGFAFKMEEFIIRAHVQGSGFEKRVIPVRLERDGSPISERSVQLDEEGRGEVTFRVKPDDVGRFTYEVSVPVYDNDAVPSNNRSPVVIRVVRDRIRVLQVAGAPSWDVKMLRRFLKGDPSVDLVSFFILRTNADLDTDYQDGELSLIEFPTDKLFNEELWRFDLVVFQNFDFEPYFGYRANDMLNNIRKYVEEEGHAFVMTGGDRSFDLGKYAGTPLENILPVRLGGPGKKVDEAPFHPKLTAAGARHPITMLAGNRPENEQWWSRLHPADGANMVAGVAPNAAVLLSHPTRKTADGSPMPVLAVREAGRGRTMALTLDSSWRWSFSEAAYGRGNQAYMRFWKNAFRWLLAEPAANRVVVDTPRENYRMGDVVRIVVQARNIDFEALPDAAVKVDIHHLDAVEHFEGVTGPDGEVVIEVPAAKQGPHRVDVVVQRNQKLVGKADTVFAVSAMDPELEEVSADTDFLKWMAQSTEGKWVAPDTWQVPLTDPEAGRTVWERRETALANAPLLAFWIALFGGLAWIVRRRSGLR